MVLAAKFAGKVSVQGVTQVTTILAILQLTVFRVEVYAVLFVFPFPSPNNAQIILLLSGALSRNDHVRNWLLSQSPQAGHPLAKVHGCCNSPKKPIINTNTFIIKNPTPPIAVPKRYFLWCWRIWRWIWWKDVCIIYKAWYTENKRAIISSFC